MSKVKLEETQGVRRLHIGSYFVDLNETDYRELVRIFSDQSRQAAVSGSVCPFTPDSRYTVPTCLICGKSKWEH